MAKIKDKKDSDFWLIKQARKYGIDIKLKEVTPEYFQRKGTK